MGVSFQSGAAELKGLNVRKEGQKGAEETAIDLRLSCETDGAVLKPLLGADEMPVFWRNDEEKNVLYTGLDSCKAWAACLHHEFLFSELHFRDVKVGKFVFKPVAGGRVELDFTVSIKNPREHDVNILVEQLHQVCSCQVLAPPDMFESDEPSLSVVDSDDDPLYPEAQRFVEETGKASISGIQRNLRIGYNRAARLLEKLESEGVVSGMDDGGQRKVLTL